MPGCCDWDLQIQRREVIPSRLRFVATFLAPEALVWCASSCPRRILNLALVELGVVVSLRDPMRQVVEAEGYVPEAGAPSPEGTARGVP
jgi:hypothetical protein